MGREQDKSLGEIQSFRDLRAWQAAVELAAEVYRRTQAFPQDERFGMVSQLRRAAVSVSANIAEGYGRGQTADYVRFLRIARGSLFEVESLVLVAERVEFVSAEDAVELRASVADVARPLSGLIASLERHR